MWGNKIPSGKAARWLLRTSLLFAALIAVFIVLGHRPLFPLGALVCFVYFFLPLMFHRELWKKKSNLLSKEGRLFLACTLSGMAAGLALNVGAPLMWLSGAYRWNESGMVSGVSFLSAAAEVVHGDYSHKVGGVVVLLLLSALLLGLALAFRPEVQKAEFGGSETQFRGLAADSVLSVWLWGFVFVEFLELLFVLSGSTGHLLVLLDEMIWDRIPTTWDLFLFYPALPGGLLVTAAMVVTMRDVMYQFDLPSDGPPIAPDGRAEGTPVKLIGIRVPGFAAAALAGFMAVAGIYMYFVHIGLVGAAASAKAFAASRLSQQALDRWIAEQQEAGRTDAEIVAAVNESGQWSPDAPEEGLARLMPALVQDPDTLLDGWTCPVTIAAGLVVVAELEAAPWPDMSALPPHVTRRSQKRQSPEDAPVPDPEEQAGETAPPAVRYCIKVNCPSPVVWRAPDAIALYSSHPSAISDWMYPVYLDLFADGVATAPGGYCTETGELADNYQG